MKKMLFCIIAIFFIMQSFPAYANQGMVNDTTKLNEIVIKLLIPEIQSSVDSFYSSYLTISPTVASYYGTEIKEIYNNQLTIETLPYVGPHISVGKDRITLTISNSGDVAIKDYVHVESHSLPEHLQSLIKKPLP